MEVDFKLIYIDVTKNIYITNSVNRQYTFVTVQRYFTASEKKSKQLWSNKWPNQVGINIYT